MEKLYKIGKSKIHGKGLIAKKNLKPGDLVGLSHSNAQIASEVGQYVNHSDNPTAISELVGNDRYLIVSKPIKKGEEISVDYRQQPELGQPEGDFEPPKEKEKALPSARPGGWLRNIFRRSPKPNPINFNTGIGPHSYLKTKGPAISFDEVIDFNKSLNLTNPLLYAHGTGSASLPGIVDYGGLGLRSSIIPMSGEMTGLGPNLHHINDFSISAVPYTNISTALDYTRMNQGGRDYLAEYNKHIDDINSGLFANEENITLFGENYSNILKDIKRRRLEAWNTADDQTKLLYEENYPMLFGFNLQKNKFGDDRIVIPRSDMGPEIGIKGGVDNKEISNIFVPESRIGITKDAFGSNLGNINVGSLEDFVPNYFKYMNYGTWPYDIQMKNLNESLLPFKKEGGDLQKFQPGGLFRGVGSYKPKFPIFKNLSIGKSGLFDANQFKNILAKQPKTHQLYLGNILSENPNLFSGNKIDINAFRNILDKNLNEMRIKPVEFEHTQTNYGNLIPQGYEEGDRLLMDPTTQHYTLGIGLQNFPGYTGTSHQSLAMPNALGWMRGIHFGNFDDYGNPYGHPNYEYPMQNTFFGTELQSDAHTKLRHRLYNPKKGEGKMFDFISDQQLKNNARKGNIKSIEQQLSFIKAINETLDARLGKRDIDGNYIIPAEGTSKITGLSDNQIQDIKWNLEQLYKIDPTLADDAFTSIDYSKYSGPLKNLVDNIDPHKFRQYEQILMDKISRLQNESWKSSLYTLDDPLQQYSIISDPYERMMQHSLQYLKGQGIDQFMWPSIETAARLQGFNPNFQNLNPHKNLPWSQISSYDKKHQGTLLHYDRMRKFLTKTLDNVEPFQLNPYTKGIQGIIPNTFDISPFRSTGGENKEYDRVSIVDGVRTLDQDSEEKDWFINDLMSEGWDKRYANEMLKNKEYLESDDATSRDLFMNDEYGHFYNKDFRLNQLNNIKEYLGRPSDYNIEDWSDDRRMNRNYFENVLGVSFPGDNWMMDKHGEMKYDYNPDQMYNRIYYGQDIKKPNIFNRIGNFFKGRTRRDASTMSEETFDDTAFHEIGHGMTNNQYGISPYAANLLEDAKTLEDRSDVSFKEWKEMQGLEKRGFGEWASDQLKHTGILKGDSRREAYRDWKNTRTGNYLTDPAEVYVRYKASQKALKDAGIFDHTTGEEWTQDHYNKLQEWMKTDEFKNINSDVREFFGTDQYEGGRYNKKIDQDKLEEIMNNVAFNTSPYDNTDPYSHEMSHAFAKYGGSLPKFQPGGITRALNRSLRPTRNISNYFNARDLFGISGANILSKPGAYNALFNQSKIDFGNLDNTIKFDEWRNNLLNEYTIESTPFKRSAMISNQSYVGGGYPLSTIFNVDGKSIFSGSKDFPTNFWPNQMSDLIYQNRIFDKTGQPIALTRNFDPDNLSLQSGEYRPEALEKALISGNPIQFDDITSFSAGKEGLYPFGRDRFIIDDFNTNIPALKNPYNMSSYHTLSRVKDEREVLLDSPLIKILDMKKNSPRPGRFYFYPEKGKIEDRIILNLNPMDADLQLQTLFRTHPGGTIKFEPQYGTDYKIDILKEKGGAIQKDYFTFVESPTDSSKLIVSNPKGLIKEMIGKEMFTPKMKMGAEVKLSSGYDIKKEYDTEKNIPYISYKSEPNIDGRIYYDSDSVEGLDNFNIIDVDSELIRKKKRHERTKIIINKYENNEELSRVEMDHLNSLGLLD